MPSRIEYTFKIWNRKGHYYLGLYFLFFLWLFSFTGLLLNHGSWRFAEFWPNRKMSSTTSQIELPQAGTALDRARDAMRQLGISGEIEWTAAKPGSTLFEFRVNRPGHNFAVSLDPAQGRAVVEHTEINAWGVMRVLHAFTGVRAGDARNERDWIMTKLWAFSMDAVAAGMMLMIASGLYLWWGLRSKRVLGAIALALGSTVCGLLLAGVRWIS
ncbi:MAG: PepSY domain-containing protein [Acidobacteria bacterium]|nr:PepSY domain-containing protein [Acidobacteriota bacterium]